MIDVGWAVLTGLTGGLAFLVVIWDAIIGGVFGARFLLVLGGTVLHRASAGVTYAIGLAAHLLLSAVFGLVYALLIEWIDPVTFAEGAAAGLLVGLAHGALATIVLAWALPHLRSPGSDDSTQGMLAGHQRSTAVIWIVAHAAFGITVGAGYTVAIL